MALQGTLEDFGIIELLQLPYHGKKTCQLILTSERGQAALYYDKGQMVHAQFQDQTGEKVIEELMDWDKGSFEMGQHIEPPERTISRDLHTLLLFVVKTRDERTFAERRGQERGDKLAKELESHLEAYRKSSGLAVHLSIMDNSGMIIAQAKDPEKTQAYISEVEQLVSNVVNTYPREGLRKAFYEDELGVVSTMRITDSWVLVAISERNCPLGAISLSMSKLAAQIAQKVGGKGDGQAPGN
jgi:predicted regulator of Ras-like GTPase activity (Roadblock/LC7/MglB family)